MERCLTDVFFLEEGQLGEGSFGIVRSCRRRTTGSRFACKSISKCHLHGSDAIAGLHAEIASMALLSSHTDIVQHIDVFQDASDVHLILEECRGGDLHCLIVRHQQLQEETARHFFRRIAGAVSFCHEHGLLHRDIKPENILLQVSPGGVLMPKLSDFGLCLPLNGNTYRVGKEVVGSAMYTAPEVMELRCYSRASDIWSLGVLLYVMIAGCFPFQGTTFLEVADSIRECQPDISSGPWERISPAVKQLICWMLSPEPGDRPSMAAILAHPWVAGSGFRISAIDGCSVPHPSSQEESCSSDGAGMAPHTPPVKEVDRMTRLQGPVRLFSRTSSSQESSSSPPRSSLPLRDRMHAVECVPSASFQSNRPVHAREGPRVETAPDLTCDPDGYTKGVLLSPPACSASPASKRRAAPCPEIQCLPKRRCADRVWKFTGQVGRGRHAEAGSHAQSTGRSNRAPLSGSCPPGVLYHRWGDKISEPKKMAPSRLWQTAGTAQLPRPCVAADLCRPLPSSPPFSSLLDGLLCAAFAVQKDKALAALEMLDAALQCSTQLDPPLGGAQQPSPSCVKANHVVVKTGTIGSAVVSLPAFLALAT